jgi:hypothetical protein
MEIHANDEGWEFSEMDPFALMLLRVLPECAAPDDDAARKRIFSAPTGGRDADDEANDEWREYVEPDLRELFKSHTDVVAADLAAMEGKGEAPVLCIPADHARAWIHTLNQARLALGARHDVTEEDTAGRTQPSGEKAFALMQIDFYASLLGLFLSRTEL